MDDRDTDFDFTAKQRCKKHMNQSKVFKSIELKSNKAQQFKSISNFQFLIRIYQIMEPEFLIKKYFLLCLPVDEVMLMVGS